MILPKYRIAMSKEEKWYWGICCLWGAVAWRCLWHVTLVETALCQHGLSLLGDGTLYIHTLFFIVI